MDRWFRWLDDAETVPENERAAQQAYDYKVRELGYRTDPMNVLPQRVLGMEEFNRRLEMRIGTRQMAETRNRWVESAWRDAASGVHRSRIRPRGAPGISPAGKTGRY